MISQKLAAFPLRFLHRTPETREPPIRAEVYGEDRLVELAQALAISDQIDVAPPHVRWLLPSLDQNRARLDAIHKRFAQAGREGRVITPAAEWLLDNYYIVQDQFREIDRDLTHSYYVKLPKLANGPYAGYPRIYGLALELIAHTDSRIDAHVLTRVVRAYESVAPLESGELWAVAIMLRLGLIENLRRLMDVALEAQSRREAAENWAERLLKNPDRLGTEFVFHVADLARTFPELDPTFVVHLLRRLRDQHPSVAPVIQWLEERLAEQGTNVEAVVHDEHHHLATDRVSTGNVITTLRTLATVNWTEFFEDTSLVDHILRDDPGGMYAQMDFATRDRYRHVVEHLSRRLRLPEEEVARRLLEQARSRQRMPEGDSDDDSAAHVGYYLIGPGAPAWKAALGYRPPPLERMNDWVLDHATPVYLGAIGLLTALFVLFMLAYGAAGAGAPRLAWLGLLAVVPASVFAVSATNRTFTAALRPRLLPKLDFDTGIPASARTIVVVPSLLSSPHGIRYLLEGLEKRFLANQDPNLYFALLGDFADAPQPHMPEDAALLDMAISGVRALNGKYGQGQGDRFYFFQRERRWNESEGVWMGWERKRGKLVEFNRLLRGARDTSYTTYEGELARLPHFRYVLTLDADTELPLNSARRLIGAIAHPLNWPKLDPATRRVVEGYGVIQPRTAITALTSARSRFDRIFAGDIGLDPYSHAVSNIYQDLFGAGIFVGKAIYDVDAALAALDDRFPDNRLLSHDLLEGLYARTALASDIELLEDFPTGYDAFMQRQRRWARGDWQIAAWLFPRVPHSRPRAADGVRRAPLARNTLPIFERWKILDNLRRSLAPLALLALLVVGWMASPGAPLFWTAVVLFLLWFPFLFNIITFLGGRPPGEPLRGFLWEVGAQAMVNGERALLTLAFLPFQAWNNADAILHVFFRLAVSHHNLLEWISAAEVEHGQAREARDFWRRMWEAPAAAVAGFLLVLAFAPSSLWLALPIEVLWFVSPYLAYWISQPVAARPEPLPSEAQRDLRLYARRTWRFFEEFVCPEDHWLPPDHFQEEPKGTVAHRTSPTNIGFYLLSALAAYDFGYVGSGELAGRLEQTISTVERLERYRGHLLNWYDTNSLDPLTPKYVSTVDSGNLVACLIAAKQACLMLAGAPTDLATTKDGLQDSLAALEADLALVEPKQPETKDSLEELNRQVQRFQSRLSEWQAPEEVSFEQTPAIQRQREFVRSLQAAADALRAQEAALEAQLGRERPTDLRFWVERLVNRLAAQSEDWDRWEGAGHRPDSRWQALADRAQRLIEATDFGFLYDEHRHIFATGYNVTLGRLDDSYYDLLATEARLASYIAIARRAVPEQHWFQMGRPLTRTDGKVALLSWGGTMFEYLMPPLLMREFEHTLLSQTYAAVVQRQMRFGAEQRVPWGVSESGFYAFDFKMNYQYRLFGIPDLGLVRRPPDNLVIAPYATLLALPFAPRPAWENLQRLVEEGAGGRYGFCEAIDYTPARRPKGERAGIVRSFMAHHQGMSLVALDNYLHKDIMRVRFNAEPEIAATELLLQEHIPQHAALVEVHHIERPFQPGLPSPPISEARYFTTPYTVTPRAHLLSNDEYSVVVTNGGGGYSAYKDLLVTRWRDDVTRDPWGAFCYLKDVASGQVWSTAYQPTLREPERYEVTFHLDRVEIWRRDLDIESRMEIIVSPENNAEIRRVSLTNTGRRRRTLELTTYAEVVLASPGADRAHPAFGNLFVESEFVAARRALVFKRRPRSAGEEAIWAVHLVTVEGHELGQLQYETDRSRFLGRGNTPVNADALDRPLTNTVGAVLDPIMSLRCRLPIAPGETARLSFTTGVSNSREGVLALADEFSDARDVERAMDLALAHSQIQLRHLNITADEAHLFQRLASRVLYPAPELRAPSDVLERNVKGQPGLWAYGISGDYPLVVVRVDDVAELSLVRQALLAHEFWRLNNFRADLVILNEHPSEYVEGLHQQVQATIDTSLSRPWIDKPGGVFLRRADQMTMEDRVLLQTVARAVLDGDLGSLADQLDRSTRRAVKPPSQDIRRELRSLKNAGQASRSPNPLPGLGRAAIWRNAPGAETKPATEAPPLFYNGLGGFSQDAREYVITLRKGEWTPAPWVNVLANPRFGALVSESGLGYTWSENSQTNKLTPWSNDPVSDPPGEALYLRDRDTGEVWSPTPLPVRETEPYIIRHGAGYTRFEHTSHSLAQDLCIFVPTEDAVKVQRLRIKNLTQSRRRVSVVGFYEWVLGVTREASQYFILTRRDQETGALFARNPYDVEFGSRVAFVGVNSPVAGYTCDRAEFIGRNGAAVRPAALVHDKFLGRAGAGLDPCAALETEIELAAGQEAHVVFVIGQGRDEDEARALAQRYRDPSQVQAAFEAVTAQWDELLGAVQVHTPDPAMDVLLNRWLLYQTLACRLWGRTAFYQSGGAYGFRDQLQDVMALVFAAPQLAREHILRAAAHQFVEGDVQHWWHPPGGGGVRTRISDDPLWLPFVTLHYLQATGDSAVLEEKAPFLKAPPLEPTQAESYGYPENIAPGTLYEHCVRALDHGLAFGPHGLPLMGTGDWNDGMNNVGVEGRGESVWLGWFLYANLVAFAQIAQARGDAVHADKYREHADRLREALEANAWDGEWYRRAYFDDGTPLGSKENQECQIDSIAQSWAVISQGAPPERAEQALNSAAKMLVRERDRIVLLLTPPFDHAPKNPGYIQGYLPGVRENGGQYTHAALWLILARVLNGEGDRAGALFNLVNPINHTRSAAEVARYKVEPYVVAADVYAQPQHIGRGGWTWYTGSAGWLYRAGVEFILGLKRGGDRFTVEPCIPREWKQYTIVYRHGRTSYAITVENPRGVNRGVARVELDGVQLPRREIPLKDDGGTHQVRVVLGG